MEATLQGLVDLLLKAVPTVIFFVFLVFYLRSVFFKPLARILEERKKATEGVRELAQRAFDAADKKASEFEHALQMARAELHHEQETLRRQWSDAQMKAIAKARAEADQRIQEAKREIAHEVERAQAELEASVETLSNRIVSTLMERRVA